MPYTSGERFIKQTLTKVIPSMQEQVLSTAENSSRLVIGIDDFTIRKGHSYNTGFHDLRNDSLLAIVKGRKLEELLKNNQLLKMVSKFSPVDVVMDLAKSYHNFAKLVFPNAICIADHFMSIDKSLIEFKHYVNVLVEPYLVIMPNFLRNTEKS